MRRSRLLLLALLVAATLLPTGCGTDPKPPPALPAGAVRCTEADRTADCQSAPAEVICSFKSTLACADTYGLTPNTFGNGCLACKDPGTHFYLKRECTEADRRICI